VEVGNLILELSVVCLGLIRDLFLLFLSGPQYNSAPTSFFHDNPFGPLIYGSVVNANKGRALLDDALNGSSPNKVQPVLASED